MKNDGKAAQSAFLARLARKTGTHVERFRDQADLRALNGGRAVNDFKKPADFLVTEDGNIHYAEVKSVQSAVSFPFGNIETGQHAAAKRQAQIGGDYRFYLFSFGLGQWFVMTAKTYVETLDAGKASIKFKDLPAWE